MRVGDEVPTLRALLREARRRLAEAGIAAAEAAVDADLIAMEALGWDRARLIADAGLRAGEREASRVEALVARRERREPMSQILGRREFWGLEFEVTRKVLTPRPETELIVELALERFADRRAPRRIADIGTGSGCLAVALAHELPGATLVATDVSEAALDVARRNARRHLVSDRIAFVRASLASGLAGPLDAIVSNPPYVPTGELPSLPPEVERFEPRLALDGGPDGLDVVRALVAEASALLADQGWLIVEIGAGQDRAARASLEAAGAWEACEVRSDLAGIPRTIVARRRTRH